VEELKQKLLTITIAEELERIASKDF